ncbi:MAG: GerAB/ArcD/ProY family transporter [Tepidibacillus sp.]
MNINPYQLFTLIVFFESSTAIAVGTGSGAKQAAWIAILIGMFAGIPLFLLYHYLYQKFPEKPLISYSQIILGKYLGWLIGIIYVLYFIYIASRDLRDFGSLVGVTLLANTPLLIINMFMIVAVAYAIGKGIEELGRLAEFFFIPTIILSTVFITVFLYFSKVIEWDRLLPFLGDGWKSILTTAFPLTFTFPFGEMIVFTMILPNLNQKKMALKTGLAGMVFSGLLISCVLVLEIMVLGTFGIQNSLFPLIQTVGLIHIDFLTRLDAIAVIILLFGVFFKVSVFYYAALLGTADLFKIKNKNQLLIPIGFIILLSSILIASNISEHLEEGLKIVPYYLHLPLQVGIPFLLFVVTLIRNRLKTKHRMKNG